MAGLVERAPASKIFALQLTDLVGCQRVFLAILSIEIDSLLTSLDQSIPTIQITLVETFAISHGQRADASLGVRKHEVAANSEWIAEAKRACAPGDVDRFKTICIS